MFEYIPKFNDLSDIEYSDFRNDEEREFMTILNSHTAEWEKYGVSGEDLFMFYDRGDLALGISIYSFRDLRIDFTETRLLLGEDETRQYVCKVNPFDENSKVYQKFDHSTAELAEIAAAWISYELSRKIELHEWITESYHYREWILVDVNRGLTAQHLKGFCKNIYELGEPTKVTIVYSGEKEK